MRILPAASLAAASLPAHALLIDATFDSSYNAAQQATVNSAISYFESILTDNVSVKINFTALNSGLGSSSQSGYLPTYNQIYNALDADRTSANDNTAVSHLSSGSSDPATGATQILITHAQCAALGFDCGPAVGGFDGTIGINLGLVDWDRSDGIAASLYDMMAVVEHEIDEILGIGGPGSGLGHGFVGVEDLFRYTSAGARSYTQVGDDAYFSIDGGATDLARFNQDSRGDYADWYSAGPHTPQVQDAFGTPGVQIDHGAAEITALDVVGWDLASASVSQSIPEPGTLVLMLPTLLALGATRRRLRS
jgi:hypothetical protein